MSIYHYDCEYRCDGSNGQNQKMVVVTAGAGTYAPDGIAVLSVSFEQITYIIPVIFISVSQNVLQHSKM